MKPNGMFSGVVAAVAVALACGCSATPSAKTASMASASHELPNAAELSSATGTTSLMSAELLGPAPRVGKAHLAIDGDDIDVGSTGSGNMPNVMGTQSDESGQKTARRSDGSRRGGDFGTSK